MVQEDYLGADQKFLLTENTFLQVKQCGGYMEISQEFQLMVCAIVLCFFLSFELTMSLEANVIKSNLIAGKLLLSMNIEAYLF